MEYRKIAKNNDEISLLGFGAMRLKQEKGKINIELARELIKYAIDHGINYFDTAYLYGDGKGHNEKVLGQIIEELGCRKEVKLSTKLNRMITHTKDAMDKMFEEELSNLRTNYIDYYFIHNVISYEDMQQLINNGLLEFIEERKNSGQIRNMGFSFHGSYEDFEKIIELYDWDMTLLQYNYLDDNMQAGIKGIKLANSKGMGVMIMEPLKGGLLADKIPAKAQEIIDNSNTEKNNVSLALNWVYNTPEVTCVLSGMNTIKMLEENIKLTENPHEYLTDDDKKVIKEVKEIIHDLNKISCTSCNYCMPCPQNINIPDIFRLYNDTYLFPENKVFIMHKNTISYAANILGVIGQKHDVSLCTHCGLCQNVCPQRLEIPELLKQADNKFHGRLIRPLTPLIKKLMGVVL
ncbi:MAG: hypothetical protein BZ136_00455 [Methanosphaera sp. rholeuAM74]|nr:MAG: hypothetical protein BZ136_00455 [Methanosphaera sp. rholeuAM74]